MAEPRPVGWPFLLTVLGVLLLAQIVLYHQSFGVKPAGDDFGPPLTEIQRGEAEGPAAFFRESAQAKNYRPVQSLLMWLFGSISDTHTVFWIHVLLVLCWAAYAGAAMLWLRIMPIGRAGVIAAGAMLVVHPVLPGAVAGIDGFSGPLATAFMWLGAWLVIALRERIVIAAMLAAVCFLIGAMTKEYSLGLGPLGVWSALMFSRTHRWRRAIIVGAGLVAALALLLMLRRLALPAGGEGAGAMVALSPGVWAKNMALLAVSLLYIGDTAWVMLRNDVVAFATVGAATLILSAWLLIGWMMRSRAHPVTTAAPSDPIDSIPRWIVYLVIAIPLATAAPILTERVSEMYAVGLVLPLALLAGIAFDGWMRRSGVTRAIGAGVLATAIAGGAVSSCHKIALLRHVGEQAERKLQLILAALPPDAHDRTVTVLYERSHLEGQPGYSIFAMNDLGQAANPRALDWIAPGRNLTLDARAEESIDRYQPAPGEIVLLWRPEAGRFERQR